MSQNFVCVFVSPSGFDFSPATISPWPVLTASSFQVCGRYSHGMPFQLKSRSSSRNESQWKRVMYVQSTPVISHHLGAKIRERELSGSPVISRFRAKSPNSRLPWIRVPHCDICTSYNQTVCWAIMGVLTFRGSLQTSTSHQQQITTSHILFW